MLFKVIRQFFVKLEFPIQQYSKSKRLHYNPKDLSLPRPSTYWKNVRRLKPFIMKVDQNDCFKQLFTPELKVLESLFKQNNYELKIAGGAVRDILLNKVPVDIDLASTATPDQMKEMFDREGIRMINTKGEQHGTITARINDKQNFEVTTLRIDTVTDGRRAEVKFTTDWQIDANRRDLTINSMFLGLDGTIYDFFHGIDDLDQRKVVFVGDATQRIQEDYLRILRYFRFYGKIAVEPDKHNAEILKAIRDNVGGLKRISGNRLWSETRKILEGNFQKEIFTRMIDLGITSYLGFPDKLDLDEFHKICDKTNPLDPQPVTVIASLLKDEVDVLNLHNRLVFSNYERDLALFLVKERNARLELDRKQIIKYYQIMIFTSSQKAKITDLRDFVCELFKYRGEKDLCLMFKMWDMVKFPISGHSLILLGVKKGPILGKVMNALKEAWVDSGFELSVDELKEMVPNFLEKFKE